MSDKVIHHSKQCMSQYISTTTHERLPCNCGAEQEEWISISDRLPEEGADVLVRRWDNSVAIYHLKMCACTDVASGESFLRPYWYPGGLPVANTRAWKYSSDLALNAQKAPLSRGVER